MPQRFERPSTDPDGGGARIPVMNLPREGAAVAWTTTPTGRPMKFTNRPASSLALLALVAGCASAPSIPDADLERLKAFVATQGYDASRLQRVPQDARP